MHPTSHAFPANARAELANPTLQRALGLAKTGFPLRRRLAIERLPEFEELREAGKAIKDHTLAHLDFYLELYERNVTAAGGTVHWARDAAEARAIVLDICRAVGCQDRHQGQVDGRRGDRAERSPRGERHYPGRDRSRRIHHPAPPRAAEPHHRAGDPPDEGAGRRRVSRGPHGTRPPIARSKRQARSARKPAPYLRPQFLAADVGITGANFLIAETGSSIIVTNEGNGDLTQTLPRVHIVMTSLEKIVPTLEDAATLLRLLARSATGQEFSSYTTMSTGPRRPGDLDGPEQYHVVLLDNGRTALLGGEFQDMLRCLRCSACLNHCPVYAAVGGHAYGWVYPGPMGAVLTPALVGIAEAGHLPNASTFCGRCESVCPVKIPLPKMMRHWRERQFAEKLSAAGLSPRPRSVGRGGAAAGAVSRADRSRRDACWLGRRFTRPFPQPAARVRLDRGARHAGAGGPHFPKPVGRTTASAAVSDAARANPRQYTRRARAWFAVADVAAELAERVAAHRRNLVPARAASLDPAARIDLFVRDGRGGADDGGAGRLARERPGRGGALSRGRKPAGRIGHGARSRARRAAVARAAADSGSGAAAPKPPTSVSLTPCLAAVAETGTLMLISGAQTPTTLNFLPDTHIVVVHAGQIVASYEDGWDLLRARGGLPRTVNFVTGPSRTGDIEQRIQLGAHGPRRLHVVLVDDREPADAAPAG